MALTLTELQEKLKQIDEISLLEVLEITSEDITMRFADKIESKYDQLVEDFEDDFTEVDGSDDWLDLMDRKNEFYTDDDLDD